MQNRRILVIDDDREIWQAYRDVLAGGDKGGLTDRIRDLLQEDDGRKNDDPVFELKFADQGRDGFELVRQALAGGHPFAVAFIDVRMPPGWDGMETALRIRQIDPEVEIVIVTAYSDRSRREIVKTVGTPEKLLFLRKPFDPEELYQLALCLSTKWNLARQEQASKRALKASEARFRSLVETSSDWVWEMDATGVFTYCSPICEVIYGYRPEELIGRKVDMLASDDDEAQRVQAFIARHAADPQPFEPYERRCRRKDGSEIFIETSGVPVIDDYGTVIGFRGIDRDITERRRNEEERRQLEMQLNQTQKMEAIGTLAGGIAHDLNNILTPILGYSEMSLEETTDNQVLHEQFQIIHQSATKAASLIRQILTFSRRQPLLFQPVNLNERIRESFKILRRLIPENIDLELDLAENLWLTTADANQLEQILINLLVNARDAIKDNGHVTIRTQNVSLTPDEAKDVDHQPMVGDYVVLQVEDNGCGMDEATRTRIFDPFFTTKEIGKGTGMGLATVYGIVRRHQGHVRLESQPGQGTTFSIYLRRSRQPTETEQPTVAPPTTGGTETILVAEDDDTVRTFIVTSLERLGYRVVAAATGLEAMELFTKSDTIDLLLTDMVLPGIGGRALVDRCRETKPFLPVVYMSGYPFEDASKALLAAKNTAFLAKPFTPEVLGRNIREILDRH